MSSIDLVNSDGTTHWSPAGDVYLNNRGPITYTVDGEDKKVTVNCSVPEGYTQKWYSNLMYYISQHGNGITYNAGSPVSVDFRNTAQVQITQNGSTTWQTVSADAYSPSGYYLSKLEGIPPLNGALAVVGGETFRWAPASSGLTIADIARPDVDCLDYIRLAGYITRIEDVLRGIAKEINGKPENSVNPTGTYGLWKQYQALRELWNYLVIRNMVVFNAQYQGDKAYIKARLSNTSMFQIPVGKMTIGFEGSSCDALWEAAESFDSNGARVEWETSSAKRQPVATGSWEVTPKTSCYVAPGGYLELSIRFSLYGTTPFQLSPTLTKRDTPWVGQWPVCSGSLVIKPGQLSWTQTHFNPTNYGGNPSGLPPTGDGCLNRFSPGTASAAWENYPSTVSPVRPSLYIGFTCTHDRETASFSSDFDQVIEQDEPDDAGSFSIERTATTATLKWTPSGNSGQSSSPSDILTITLNNRHFHEGDGIALSIPKGWCQNMSGSSLKVVCVWDIPANQLIENDSEAGGEKNLNIPSEAGSSKVLKKRITLNSQQYTVDSVRTPYLYVSVSETDDDPPFS